MVDLRIQIPGRDNDKNILDRIWEESHGKTYVVAPQTANPPEISAREVLLIANRNNLVNFVQKGSLGKNLLGFYSVIHWFTICILEPFP